MKSFQLKSLLLLAAVIISLPLLWTRTESVQAEERSFRIYMGRRIQIGRIRTGRRTCRFHQRPRRVHGTCTLPGARHV